MDRLNQQMYMIRQQRRRLQQQGWQWAPHVAPNPQQMAVVMKESLHRIREYAKRDDLVEKYERILVDGDILSYSAQNGKVGVYVAGAPLTPENNYFEVEILDTGTMGSIGIGLVPEKYPLDHQPGCYSNSVAYHADDGNLFKSNGFGRPFGPKCNTGDHVGCGIKFDQVKVENLVRSMFPVFFTRNGREVGTVLAHLPHTGHFPAVGMQSEGEEVRVNLDAQWEHSEVILMSIDNCEEEWARLHDIRINGQLLEYVGRGSSNLDVGLAQARTALDTRHHYFEIEIVDPGEKCYIAIGLARKDYPKHRHPGWNKGSIAYHADDGKIFLGSGVGDQFGPCCHKGDIMGCGILFPRDYTSEADSDGSAELPGTTDLDDPHNDCEDYVGLVYEPNSESEDEEIAGDKPIVDDGTQVKVFFTRNGQVIGDRSIHIPRGGFYPTVGMLSVDEKVRVDLRPLTG